MKRADLIKLKMEYRGDDIIRNLIMGIIADCDRKTTSPSEEQIQDVIKSTIKSNKNTLADLEGTKYSDDIIRIQKEIKFLEGFLPAKMSKEEICQILADLDAANIGEVMSYFRSNYGDKCDNAMVAKIFKEGL